MILASEAVKSSFDLRSKTYTPPPPWRDAWVMGINGDIKGQKATVKSIDVVERSNRFPSGLVIQIRLNVVSDHHFSQRRVDLYDVVSLPT